jgi:ABC-type lipoprotein release transport system permease subunit
LVLGQTVRILAAGIGPGLLLSVLTIRLARHVLFGSILANSFAALTATIVLVIAGSGAASIPARRAALADPLETLRQE